MPILHWHSLHIPIRNNLYCTNLYKVLKRMKILSMKWPVIMRHELAYVNHSIWNLATVVLLGALSGDQDRVLATSTPPPPAGLLSLSPVPHSPSPLILMLCSARYAFTSRPFSSSCFCSINMSWFSCGFTNSHTLTTATDNLLAAHKQPHINNCYRQSACCTQTATH